MASTKPLQLTAFIFSLKNTNEIRVEHTTIAILLMGKIKDASNCSNVFTRKYMQK
jgi:hypothetical protein